MAQFTGKVTKIYDEVSGEGPRGTWVRGCFMVSQLGEVERQAAFVCFGEKRIGMVRNLRVGQTVVVEYYPESRENGEHVYTDLHAYRVLHTVFSGSDKD